MDVPQAECKRVSLGTLTTSALSRGLERRFSSAPAEILLHVHSLESLNANAYVTR